MRKLLALALLCGAVLPMNAQKPTKLNLQLQAFLKRPHAPTEEVDLFIRGEERGVAAAVAARGGRVKLIMNGLVSATVPVAEIEALAASDAVDMFEFTLSKGRTLNDSMRVKTRVVDVQQGRAPLPTGYMGEGTIIGIIDSGMDLGHPDFNDSLGNTRVLHYWDQNFPFDNQLTPQPYGYGQAWDSTAINAGNCPATDQPQWYGHGTTVVGTAAGNGLATGAFEGVAPKADIIMVSSDFGRPNWRASVADAVKYIFDQATALGRPVVVNASLGDYYGSHDGLDAAALFIDSLLNEAPGRALVCAAGNSFTLPPYHLHTEVSADTSFTWFTYQPASISNLGVGGVFFEVWADTASFDQVEYAVGVDRTYANIYSYRGRSPFHRAQDNLGLVVTDTLVSPLGNRMAILETRAELRGAQYHLEVVMAEPDSSDFYFRFMTTGQGSFDVWSSYYLGSSTIIAGGLPTPTQFPDIVKYVLPDNEQKIVDSWACSEHVLTVANYQNETNYIDYNGLPQSVTGIENDIASASSNGPTRDGRLKPDLAAPGDITFSAGPASFIASLLAGTGAFKVAPGGYHLRAGGTSIASPVAAGSIALYFEKCPNATHLDAIRSFELSAFGDVFTGALPNIRWGAGKLNAYDALVRSAEVPITFDPSPVMCFNDSVLVSGPNAMSAYAWNTGASTQSFYASEQSVISLEVIDDHGCHAWSDTLAVLEDAPVPTPTISQVGYTLESSAAIGYQWFYNGAPISGATDQTLDVYDTGDYFVQVSNVNGCTANSDTLFVLSTGLGVPARASGLVIWPVPASDAVSIRLPMELAGRATLEIADAQGKLVQRHSLQSGSPVVQLSLEGLSTGLYQVRISDGARSWTGSIQLR